MPPKVVLGGFCPCWGDFRRIAGQAVGAGFYPACVGRSYKPAQQTATSLNVRRGRCPHRPGRMQSQNCTLHRRKRKMFCRGGRLCPPAGHDRFAATFRKNGRAYRTGRCGHRPLQTLYGFAGVHSFLTVRPAGRTGSSAPTGAYHFALVHPYLQRCPAREG